MPASRRTRCEATGRAARSAGECPSAVPPSPFARACQLADTPDDEVALDAAQAIHEQRAVEMIHLVLKRARQQAGALVLVLVALAVESLDHGARRADDGR